MYRSGLGGKNKGAVAQGAWGGAQSQTFGKFGATGIVAGAVIGGASAYFGQTSTPTPAEALAAARLAQLKEDKKFTATVATAAGTEQWHVTRYALYGLGGLLLLGGVTLWLLSRTKGK